MSKKTKHNPERKSWKGRSYKKGGVPIKKLKDCELKKVKEKYHEY